MDQILTTEDNPTDEEFNSKSSSRVESDESFLDCLLPAAVKEEKNLNDACKTANSESKKIPVNQEQSDDKFTNELSLNIANDDERYRKDIADEQIAHSGSDLTRSEIEVIDTINQVDECDRVSNKLLNERENLIDGNESCKTDYIESNINLVSSINSQIDESTDISCDKNYTNSANMLFHNVPEAETTSFTKMNEHISNPVLDDTTFQKISDTNFSSSDLVCKADEDEQPEMETISEVNHNDEGLMKGNYNATKVEINFAVDRSEENVAERGEGDDYEIETTLPEGNHSGANLVKGDYDVARMEIEATINDSEENVDKTFEVHDPEMENHCEESIGKGEKIAKMGINIAINQSEENLDKADGGDNLEKEITSPEVNHNEENVAKGDLGISEMEINTAIHRNEGNVDQVDEGDVPEIESSSHEANDIKESLMKANIDDVAINNTEENVNEADKYDDPKMEINFASVNLTEENIGNCEHDNNPKIEISSSEVNHNEENVNQEEEDAGPETEITSTNLDHVEENTANGEDDNNHNDVDTEITSNEANHSEQNINKRREELKLREKNVDKRDEDNHNDPTIEIISTEVNHYKESNNRVNDTDFTIEITSNEINRGEEISHVDSDHNDDKIEITSSEVNHSKETVNKENEDANKKMEIGLTKINPSEENNGTVDETTADDLTNRINEGSTDDVLQNRNTAVKLNKENKDSSSIVESFLDCSSGKDTTESNLVNITSKRNNSNGDSEFIPTIVDIRGACTDVLEDTLIHNATNEKLDASNSLHTNTNGTNVLSETSELPQINIVSVQGGVKEIIPTSETCQESTITENGVKTIGYNNSSSADHMLPDSSCNDNATIKQEPQDIRIDDDCTYISTEHASSCFTSEIFIKEEKPANSENAELDVVCIESSSKIPLPIPIKTEANIENEAQSISAEPVVQKTDKRIPQPNLKKTRDFKTVSSGSEREDSSDSRERNKAPKSRIYSSVGYTCHLCNTTFQEHELLNEHMILHRNNSLIQTKAMNKTKPKAKGFPCQKCDKRLSTWQSLQQHLMIHSNEKPHVCSVCNKDFRHLSNYKMHIQKHKQERPRYKERERLKESPKLDKSIVRAVDFGRLVGPLFVKETLLNQKNKEVDVKKAIQTRSTFLNKDASFQRLSFDRPTVKIRDNTKENLTSNKKDAACVKMVEEIEDEIIPLKTFNNVENIVMNAARFIVRLDNLDANLLKRKIKTPDISIDRGVERKRRIVLPLTYKNKKLKLDQIENIIMDIPPVEEVSKPLSMADESADDTFDRNCDDDDHQIETTSKSEPTNGTQTNSQPLHGTLTDNELFELLNDGREVQDEPSARDFESELRDNAKKILRRESETAAKNLKCEETASKSSSQTVSSILTRSSTNAATQRDESMPSLVAKRTGDETSAKSGYEPTAKRMKIGIEDEQPIPSVVASDVTPLDDMCAKTTTTVFDIEDEWEKYDAFDTAFHKVAMRRLALMIKRAAQNGGKLENRYLLGPLFWLKALRRAEQNRIDQDVVVPTIVGKQTACKRIGNRVNKADERRTNDPAKLQIRAESKLKCVLDRVRMMSDLNNLNLVGPLFWKKTLKLAGIRTVEDMKTLLDERLSLTLQGIQFVNRCELRRSWTKECLGDAESAIVDSNLKVVDTGQTLAPSEQSKLVDGMLNDELLETGEQSCDTAISSMSSKDEDSNSSTAKEVSCSTNESSHVGAPDKTEFDFKSNAKIDSILYESLTKPRDTPVSTRGDKLKTIVESTFVNERRSAGTNAESENRTSDDDKAAANDASTVKNGTPDPKLMVSENSKKEDTEASARLTGSSKTDAGCSVADSAPRREVDEKVTDAAAKATVEDGNIVLNVDGGFQLIAPPGEKAADMQEGGNYVLVSDETGAMQYVVNVPGENYGNLEFIGDANGEQLTFAIQLDGENYSAVQFVQNNGELGDAKCNDEESVKGEKMDAVADPSHIGKELSDFLNLDYGTLIKENADEGKT